MEDPVDEEGESLCDEATSTIGASKRRFDVKNEVAVNLLKHFIYSDEPPYLDLVLHFISTVEGSTEPYLSEPTLIGVDWDFMTETEPHRLRVRVVTSFRLIIMEDAVIPKQLI